MDATIRSAALDRLEKLVGEWDVEAHFPSAPEPVGGRAVFSWDLDRQVLVQRSSADHPQAPDGLCLHSVAEDGDGTAFVQHYFDSRGVVRLYRMTLTDDEWVLLRTEPDFTPLSFAQRFVGTFSPDGRRIDGRCELSHDGGATWERDFRLDYVKAG